MHHHRLLALAAGLLALAITIPAQAQTWSGTEAIGIQASDSKGKPIPEARVVLSFQGRGSEGNPPQVATDSKGRAVVAGLAAGPWQVEVLHPDFLSYVAVFELSRGKKPSINASFLEAGGRSLTPMKVKLSKGNPRNASSPLPSQETRTQTAPPVKAAPAPRPTIEDEPVPHEKTEPQPAPAPVSQVAEEPPAPSAAEPAAAEIEPSIPEVQEVRVPELPPMPDPEPEEEDLPAPQEVEPQPEPTIEAPSVTEEPESQPGIPTETVATEAAPTELEPALAPEVAEEIAETQEPLPGEPEPGIAKPVEEAPPIELTEVTETPSEPQPSEALPESTSTTAVQSGATEEAPSLEPTPAKVPESMETAEVEPAPAPAVEAPAVEPAAPPSAPSIAVPRDAPEISTYRDGSCSECRTGEWAVTATQAVAAGSVPCPAAVTPAAREAADGLGNSMQLELSGFVGPAADGSSNEALKSAESSVSQAYTQKLGRYLGGVSNCQVVSVVLPKSVRFVGFRYEAYDDASGGECAPDRGCPLAQVQWLASPVVQRGFNATVVWGIFENTSAEEPRFARLKVYFRPPNASWQPPTR